MSVFRLIHCPANLPKLTWTILPFTLGFPGGSDSKESACNAGNLGLIPELG